MKLITLALRDFALPSPPCGSIESYSGSGRAAAEGREIHLRVQKMRKCDPSYQAEVPVSCLLEREGYCFCIDGRMDGIFRTDPPLIEEIKSGFSIVDLSRRLADNPLGHPYSLQLLSYGYFHWREQGVLPRLRFHLASFRSRESLELELHLDIPRFESWLESRLKELASEARLAEKRAARRRKVSASFPFPFATPRSGQIDLMQNIQEGMEEGRAMLLQAPTGLGKTVGVLFPLLKEVLSRGQRVVYVTPKNSQHGVAEDAVDRFQQAGAKIRSLTITAKGKICFRDEPLCDPGCCEYARDYYAKLHDNDILAILARKRRLKARTFRQLGEQYLVCPFELQLDSAREADLVICDYNYVFAPRSALGRMSDMAVDQEGKPSLVIDEAHNLPGRAMEYYSPLLSSQHLEQLRHAMGEIRTPFSREALQLLDACLATLVACGGAGASRPRRIAPPLELFQKQDERLRALLSRYLDSGVEPGREDPLLRLSFSWSEFTRMLELAADPGRSEFFTTWHPHGAGGTVKITCCDASEMLKECYGDYGQVVAFSATLKPFDYYARLSGLNPETVRTAEFPSPFPPELRKLLLIPQVSTRYSRREANYARIADAVGRIAGVRRGNYLVFLPSFPFLERVLELFHPPEGFAVLRQERDMGARQVEEILERLREQNAPIILFAVQGGSFSEGVDYAGEMVIGAFVVGPPLPNYDFQREQMRAYYQKNYGAGFQYAYTIPAMARAVQAAGRVIRSETDRGLIVLMDDRFLEPDYAGAMPADWFGADVRELVSGSILKDVEEFWAGTELGRQHREMTEEAG
jgi:DNA excision repair protein ERCC-2